MPPRLRPRFDLDAEVTPAEVTRCLNAELSRPDAPVRGMMVGRHARLRLPDEVVHFWSPHLEIEIKPSDHGSHIEGLFGPHPNVWTMFMAIYAVLAFTALGGLMFGISQWSIGQAPTALWSLPILAALFALTYGIALSGQRLAQEQMHQLRSFVDTTVHRPIAVS